MRAEIKDGLLIVIPESDAERAAFGAWRALCSGHVFYLDSKGRDGALHDLGPREIACNEPINIGFNATERRWRIISNLAPTPFTMRGRSYASVEGFWQGLKFPDEATRARVAQLAGTDAVKAASRASAEGSFMLDGQSYGFGGPGHHALMTEACWAKFTQHDAAREALLATGTRPLTHRMRRDSVTIPGALMTDIWMRIRDQLRHGHATICYFDRDRAYYGFLSHFEPSPIVLDGEHWPTVEHYYQTQKSFDPAYRLAIRQNAAPGVVKQLATTAKPGAVNPASSWFAQTGEAPRADWAEVKLDIMRRADWAKFSQNPHLAARLLETGDAELIEDSPLDGFWGVGPDGEGLNWAGRVLMEVRTRLRQEGTRD
jgi:ribA/ribD-fused uncharacterized protein